MEILKLWRVFVPANNVVAAAMCSELEAALVLASFYGNGSTIRKGGRAKKRIVFMIGESSGLSPDESIDDCVVEIEKRIDDASCGSCGKWVPGGLLGDSGFCDMCLTRKHLGMSIHRSS